MKMENTLMLLQSLNSNPELSEFKKVFDSIDTSEYQGAYKTVYQVGFADGFRKALEWCYFKLKNDIVKEPVKSYIPKDKPVEKEGDVKNG